MHLKRIYLQGFKSFADAVTLDLAPGITAVVGPNGSGKSNVVEAVRWVLGEQSARRLRGYRMDDLIFGGSRKRRPVNLAEVTLVIDDEDGRFGAEFTEVAVTRRVDREGTAEFFINRVPCRLRDIQELFFDTGLGRAPYALVGQGELDVLVTGRPEERGAMLEEVAGLTRVRERVTSVRRRMARLDPSRGRLSDMLADMESRLEPLRIQAGRTLRHEEMSSRLRALERSLQLHRMALLQGDAEAKEARCEQLSSRLDTEREAADQDRKAASEVRAALDAASRGVEDLRRSVGRGTAALQEALHAVQSAEDRLESLATEGQRLTGELKTSWSRWQSLREQRRGGLCEEQQLLQAVSEMAGELGRLEEQAQEIEDRAESVQAGADQGIDQARQRLRELDQTVARLAQQVSSGEDGLVALGRRVEDMSAAVSKASLEEAESAAELERAEAALTASDGEAREVEKELGEVRSRLSDVRRQREALERERASLIARLEALAEMERLGAGYGEGTRFLLGKGDSRGIVGSMGQLVRPRAGFEGVLDALLEATASDLIVDGREAADSSVQQLKKARSGRATFWIRDQVLDRSPVPGERPDLPGLVATGPDVVDPDCPGAGVAFVLLSDVLVFETLSQVPAADVLRRMGARAVTLDGDIVFPGGVRGGSGGSGIWSRRQEVHELGERLGRMKSDLDGLVEQGEELQARHDALEESAAGLKAQGQALAVRRDMWRQRCEEARERVADSRRHRAETMAELEQLKADLGESRERLAEASVSRDELEDSLRDLEAERALRLDEGRNLEGELSGVRDLLSRTRAEMESRRGRLDVRRSWNSDLTQDLMGLAGARRDLIHGIAGVAEERTAREKALEELRVRAKDLEESLGADRDRLSQLESVARSNEHELSGLETTISGREERLARLEGRLHREELALARVATELSGVRQLLEDRGVTDDEMTGAAVLDDPEDVAGQASALRDEITSMGVVNPLAVDECERLESEWGKLREAVNDIEEAAAIVDQIRVHLERSMRKVFLDVLGEIDARFLTAFERLFGGGEARLLLAESACEDQVPGIDVVAQPPGKKLQHLSLLSGGERALTATAFLFGLLDYLPAPFVVFDEIDAALDEQNAKRFTDYLRDLSERSQVVIVTHQRVTMEGADMLYGTTMDDSGVTQVVPVRLSEIEA